MTSQWHHVHWIEWCHYMASYALNLWMRQLYITAEVMGLLALVRRMLSPSHQWKPFHANGEIIWLWSGSCFMWHTSIPWHKLLSIFTLNHRPPDYTALTSLVTLPERFLYVTVSLQCIKHCILNRNSYNCITSYPNNKYF